ncbi:hypothetical protein HW555_013797 [Spodoptera exigua]|uniref:Uncharacterized protein n=1 Tax=Spodoptera exigua TaxID=7107 RepID=A0A835G0U5_SPOEX|nr:hypothetical protein HW555_013797 [Spodoptera exigua]
MPQPLRDASGRFLPKGPSQGQPKGPSQGQPKGPSQGQPKSRDASASETSRAPSAASLLRGGDMVSDLSDTESNMSGTTGGSTRQSRKRAFLRQDSRGSPDQAEKPPKRAVVQADLEERIASKEQRTRTTRAKAGYGASSVLYADHSVEEMERMALEDQEEILEVASKSSNLKGTFQKALKCRAASLLGIVKELAQRTTSDETRQLQAKVDRLQKEVSALHARVAELMARPEGTSEGPASMLAPSNLEDIIRKVIMEERAFTRACFAGIEDRLLPEKRLRPPLASDRVPERTPGAPGPSTAPAQREQPKGKGKGKGKKTTPAAPTAQTAPQTLPREDPLLPSTTPSNQPWVKVVSRKKKGKKSAPKPPASVRLDCGAEGAQPFSRERENVREEVREAITRHWAEELASAEFGRRTERENVREEVREAITRHWAEELASAAFGRRTLDAIGPGQTKSRDASASETSRAPSAASLARGSDIVSDFSDNESILSGTTAVPHASRESGPSLGRTPEALRTKRRSLQSGRLFRRTWRRGSPPKNSGDPNHQSQGWLRRLQRPLRGPLRRGNGAHGSGGSAGDLGGGLQVLQSERDLSEGPEMPGSELARHRQRSWRSAPPPTKRGNCRRRWIACKKRCRRCTRALPSSWPGLRGHRKVQRQ